MICDRTTQLDIRKLTKFTRPFPDIFHVAGIPFRTTWTETNFGGRRQWFLCSICVGRCAIIYYHAPTLRVGCRVCLNGHYASEHMSPKDRRLHAAFKVRDQLGQKKGGIVATFPPKPKGMHWRTYQKIRSDAVQNEAAILIQAHADFCGISVDDVRQRLLLR